MSGSIWRCLSCSWEGADPSVNHVAICPLCGHDELSEDMPGETIFFDIAKGLVRMEAERLRKRE